MWLGAIVGERRAPSPNTILQAQSGRAQSALGNGDVNSAADWSCPFNEDFLQIGPNGALAGLEGPER